MAAYILDTNVLAVAEAPTHQAGLAASKKCSELLTKIKDENTKDTIRIDNHRLILMEYHRHFNEYKRQEGLGRAFLKWLQQNYASPSKKIEIVKITPNNRVKNEFKEFPLDPALKAFHVNDRKFVAVAKAKKKPKAPIVHATDKGWKVFESVLRKNGVEIIHLCP